MSPLPATSLQVGMDQSPIIFLQDALRQGWEGSAQNLAATANLKFFLGKTRELQTKQNQKNNRWMGCQGGGETEVLRGLL